MKRCRCVGACFEGAFAMYSPPKRVGYVLFVDESGDDGYSTVWPIDADGASEWLVLGGVLVKAENSRSPVEWVREFKRGIKGSQSPILHFYDLSDAKRLEVCQHIASKGDLLRCFVVISNKRNMRGYRNLRAERWDTRNPMYNWLFRVLIEKASHFCAKRSMHDYGEMRSMRIELGARGGVSIPRIRVYLYKLRNQSQSGRMVVKREDISWACIDDKQIAAIPARERAGIQLADVVVSAFGKAVDRRYDGGMEPKFANALFGVMAQKMTGLRAGYSVKLLPNRKDLWKAELSPQHVAFFEGYGYERSYLMSPDPRLAKRRR